ncbi:MAG: rhamnogalacturonan acetylesterase [Clostridia bacterium]|nr:rhamnogalacturonan acetylesterase [Clostridia bacterium]
MQIFICGDSTAASYNPAETLMVGWGQLLEDFLQECSIVNLAMAGRSTKTFLQEGRLFPVGEQARPGDLVLIQFAHNDENEKKPERYCDAHGAFRENLQVFIRYSREYGAMPILLTPICMRVWQDGRLQPTHGKYPAVMRQVAEEAGVSLIDLYTESYRIVESLGEEGSKELFMQLLPGQDERYPEGLQDNAHTRRAGAERFAAAAARELKAMGLVR